MTPLTPAQISWRDGTPYAPGYDDVYHSAAGGLAQARAVFLAGCGLPAAWAGRPRFTVLETGFGLGTNFLATWHAWLADPQRCTQLHYIAVEKHPLSGPELAALPREDAAIAALAQTLTAAWPPVLPGLYRLPLAGDAIILDLLFGDVSQLDSLDCAADALYLDGFAPAKNPAMWDAAACRRLAARAAPGARLASWCVAGEVRRQLQQAGFQVEKHRGFAGKRERLCGHKPGTPPAPPAPGHAAVIGAGLAGAAVSERLAARGWHISLFDAAQPASGASGNPVGVYRPMFSRDDGIQSRLTRAACQYARPYWQRLQATGEGFPQAACGILHLARDAAEADKFAAILADYPADYLRTVDVGEARARSGQPYLLGGYWIPDAGWLAPAALCAAQLAAAGDRLSLHTNCAIQSIQRSAAGWQLHGTGNQLLGEFTQVIVTSANDAARLLPGLILTPVRGQLSAVPAGSLPPVPCILAREGYLTPAACGQHVFGATYEFDDLSLELRADSHHKNLQRLVDLLPGGFGPLPQLGGRAALRATTSDRLPHCGAWADGLHVFSGLGSRGIVWAALGAEHLACRLSGAASPLPAPLLRALDPHRFAPTHPT
jgi:tRNA 5-methylaminomethyl-2-thiouridine biosynthesis bifunctional protein